LRCYDFRKGPLPAPCVGCDAECDLPEPRFRGSGAWRIPSKGVRDQEDLLHGIVNPQVRQSEPVEEGLDEAGVRPKQSLGTDYSVGPSHATSMNV